jgi:hypothetical protein
MDGSVCTNKGLDGHGHGGRGTFGIGIALGWAGLGLASAGRSGRVVWFCCGMWVACGRGCHVLRARHPSRMLRQNEIHTGAAWTPRSLTTALTRQEVEEATAVAAVAADAPGASLGSSGWPCCLGSSSRREMGMDGYDCSAAAAARAERGNDCRDGRIVLLTTVIGRVTMVAVGEPLFGRHTNPDSLRARATRPSQARQARIRAGLGKDGTDRYLGS